MARALVREMRGALPEPFRFNKLGRLTLLGDYDAVAEIGPLTLTGPVAWLLWHAFYAGQLGSWRTRVNLVADRLLAALLGRETSEIPLQETN